MRDQRYPQATLTRSLFDRRLMGLADRGGASGHVGKAWGEISGEWLRDQIGQQFPLRDGSPAVITGAIEIDGIAGLPAFASSRGLQNPDFLVEVETADGRALIAADAKFSIETGKPRQVSAEITHALLDTEGSPVRAHVEPAELTFDGFFISPDFALTTEVLTGRIGILRVAVSADTVVTIPAEARRVFPESHLNAAMSLLETMDSPHGGWPDDLVVALYYARCAFACLACFIDETKPLLGPGSVDATTSPVVVDKIDQRRRDGRSAWALVKRWDDEAEAIRAIRIRVHQAAEPGIPNRALRELVEHEATTRGAVPPSISRVRRELALWANREMVERFGVIHHPAANLEGFIDELRRHAQSLERVIPEQVRRIVAAA